MKLYLTLAGAGVLLAIAAVVAWALFDAHERRDECASKGGAVIRQHGYASLCVRADVLIKLNGDK